LWIARIKSREKIERDRTRKFRRGAKTAFFGVETPGKLFVGCLKNLIVDLSGGLWLCVLRFAKRIQNLRSLLGNFLVVLLPSRRNSIQYLGKTRLTESIFRRKISPADERFQIGREPDTHRPTAAAGCRLDKGHINAIDIGPFF